MILLGKLATIFLLDLKIVKVDLSVFRVILLAVNQEFNAVIIILPIEISSFIVLSSSVDFVRRPVVQLVVRSSCFY